MINNDLIGKIVISTAGRDKNELYLIIDQIEDNLLLCNGNTKKMETPKKKKSKHLDILADSTDDIKNAIRSNEKGVDLKIKRFLKLKGIVKEG